MNIRHIFAIVFSLLIGFLIGTVATGGDKHMDHDDRMHEMHNENKDMMHDEMEDEMHEDSSMDMNDAMHKMSAALEGKEGSEFDAAFLHEMTIHHEGAVEMAKSALEHANNPELKAMAEAIIAAQEAEIIQMQEWKNSWFPPEVQ